MTVLGLGLRAVNRKLRWVGRLVGLFLAFLVFELLSKHYETDYMGALDPYIGALLAYTVGGWLVTFIVFWFLGSMVRNLFRLFGRG